MSVERALVIGATGFIGSHIAGALAHSDIEVEALRRWNASPEELDERGIRTAVADLLDKESLLESLAGFNYVFMAAAPDPTKVGGRAYLRRSVRGMRHLLEVCRELDVERVIVTSCATTVAPPERGALAAEEDVYLPGTAGDFLVEAQYAAEQECFREAADGMDIALLNPGICIGEGAVIPSRRLLEDVDDGARINLVDVDDVARAHLAVAGLESFGQRYVLGGENVTVGELFERLELLEDGRARLGRYTVRVVDERPKVRRVLPLYRHGKWLDSEFAEKRFGFRPRTL